MVAESPIDGSIFIALLQLSQKFHVVAGEERSQRLAMLAPQNVTVCHCLPIATDLPREDKSKRGKCENVGEPGGGGGGGGFRLKPHIEVRFK